MHHGQTGVNSVAFSLALSTQVPIQTSGKKGAFAVYIPKEFYGVHIWDIVEFSNKNNVLFYFKECFRNENRDMYIYFFIK